MVTKVISGGQTGVDRAALDVALKLEMPCGGWCPKDRRAEDGMIPPRYPLQGTPTAEYLQRTEWNVRYADGTLVLNAGALEGGTAETVTIASRLRKPLLVVDLDKPPSPAEVSRWLVEQRIATLNVAGPREGKRPGIYGEAVIFLQQVFTHAP